MATFAIHEDEVLKENACVPRLVETKLMMMNNQQQKQPLQQQQQQPQRKTFGVLNNAQLGARTAHAQQKTVIIFPPIQIQHTLAHVFHPIPNTDPLQGPSHIQTISVPNL